jgi:hypothetical protein
VALVRLAAMLLDRAAAPAAEGVERDGWLTAGMVAAVLLLQARLAMHQQPDEATVAPALAYLEMIAPADGSVSVDSHWYPSVRYFYEHGSFAGSPLYPRAFRFPHWNAPTPLVVQHTRWLITHRSVRDAQAQHRGVTIVAHPALPRALYRVEATGDRRSP